jgi:hypothetical protein
VLQAPPIEYLFDPQLVKERLGQLPRLALLLRDPLHSAPQSAAFPKLRKTRREIVRVIGRDGLYEHLDRLLNELEALLGLVDAPASHEQPR